MGFKQRRINPGKDYSYSSAQICVAAEAIAENDLVYISGFDGVAQVTRTDASALISTRGHLLVAKHAIPSGERGVCLPWRIINGDTSGYTAGDPIYVDDTTPGGFLQTPAAGTLAVRVIGHALNSATEANGGKFMLSPSHPSVDLVDVQLTDNDATAWVIEQGTNAYMTFVTTDNQEVVQANQQLELAKGREHQSYVEFFDDFFGDPGTAIAQPWVADAQTANITVDYTSGLDAGVVRILTDSTSEAQSGNLTFGDTLHINMSNNPILEARIRFAPAGTEFTADERFVVGFASAHTNAEDALDSVTTNCWFRVEGANLNILIESDDGTTDDDDNDSAIDIVKSAWTVFKIDASDLSAVAFYVDDVLVATTLDMSALGANTYVQPIVCMQRDAGTEVNSLDVDYIQVVVDR